jgi:hypothetical protein
MPLRDSPSADTALGPHRQGNQRKRHAPSPKQQAVDMEAFNEALEKRMLQQQVEFRRALADLESAHQLQLQQLQSQNDERVSQLKLIEQIQSQQTTETARLQLQAQQQMQLMLAEQFQGLQQSLLRQQQDPHLQDQKRNQQLQRLESFSQQRVAGDSSHSQQQLDPERVVSMLRPEQVPQQQIIMSISQESMPEVPVSRPFQETMMTAVNPGFDTGKPVALYPELVSEQASDDLQYGRFNNVSLSETVNVSPSQEHSHLDSSRASRPRRVSALIVSSQPVQQFQMLSQQAAPSKNGMAQHPAPENLSLAEAVIQTDGLDRHFPDTPPLPPPLPPPPLPLYSAVGAEIEPHQAASEQRLVVSNDSERVPLTRQQTQPQKLEQDDDFIMFSPPSYAPPPLPSYPPPPTPVVDTSSERGGSLSEPLQVLKRPPPVASFHAGYIEVPVVVEPTNDSALSGPESRSHPSEPPSSPSPTKLSKKLRASILAVKTSVSALVPAAMSTMPELPEINFPELSESARHGLSSLSAMAESGMAELTNSMPSLSQISDSMPAMPSMAELTSMKLPQMPGLLELADIARLPLPFLEEVLNFHLPDLKQRKIKFRLPKALKFNSKSASATGNANSAEIQPEQEKRGGSATSSPATSPRDEVPLAPASAKLPRSLEESPSDHPPSSLYLAQPRTEVNITTVPVGRRESNMGRESTISRSKSRISLPPADPTSFEAIVTKSIKTGYLVKMAKQSGRNWKRRLFTLSRFGLAYYVDEAQIVKAQGPQGEVHITGDSSVTAQENNEHGFCFRLTNPWESIKMAASTESDREDWITAISNLIELYTDCKRGQHPKTAAIFAAKKYYIITRSLISCHPSHTNASKVESICNITTDIKIARELLPQQIIAVEDGSHSGDRYKVQIYIASKAVFDEWFKFLLETIDALSEAVDGGEDSAVQDLRQLGTNLVIDDISMHLPTQGKLTQGIESDIQPSPINERIIRTVAEDNEDEDSETEGNKYLSDLVDEDSARVGPQLTSIPVLTAKPASSTIGRTGTESNSPAMQLFGEAKASTLPPSKPPRVSPLVTLTPLPSDINVSPKPLPLQVSDAAVRNQPVTSDDEDDGDDETTVLSEIVDEPINVAVKNADFSDDRDMQRASTAKSNAPPPPPPPRMLQAPVSNIVVPTVDSEHDSRSDDEDDETSLLSEIVDEPSQRPLSAQPPPPPRPQVAISRSLAPADTKSDDGDEDDETSPLSEIVDEPLQQSKALDAKPSESKSQESITTPSSSVNHAPPPPPRPTKPPQPPQPLSPRMAPGAQAQFHGTLSTVIENDDDDEVSLLSELTDATEQSSTKIKPNIVPEDEIKKESQNSNEVPDPVDTATTMKPLFQAVLETPPSPRPPALPAKPGRPPVTAKPAPSLPLLSVPIGDEEESGKASTSGEVPGTTRAPLSNPANSSQTAAFPAGIEHPTILVSTTALGSEVSKRAGMEAETDVDDDSVSLLSEIIDDDDNIPVSAPANSVGGNEQGDSQSKGVFLTGTGRWLQKTSTKHKGRPYWKNLETGQTTWKNPLRQSTEATVSPVSLPEQKSRGITVPEQSRAVSPKTEAGDGEGTWSIVTSSRFGKAYWRNTKTGKISWTDPNPSGENDSKSPASSQSPQGPRVSSPQKASQPASAESASGSSPSKSPSTSSRVAAFFTSSSSEPLRGQGTEKWTVASPPQVKAAPDSGAANLPNLSVSLDGELPTAVPPENVRVDDEEVKKKSEELRHAVEEADSAVSANLVPKYNLMRVPTTAHVQVGSGFGRSSVLVSATDVWEEMFSNRHKMKFWKHKYTGELTYKDPFEKDREIERQKETQRIKQEKMQQRQQPKSEEAPLKPQKQEEQPQEQSLTQQLPVEQEKQQDQKEEPSCRQEDIELGNKDVDLDQHPVPTAPQPLWVEEFSGKYKRKFWRNTKTKEVVWKCPFPEGETSGKSSQSTSVGPSSPPETASEGQPRVMSRRMTAYFGSRQSDQSSSQSDGKEEPAQASTEETKTEPATPTASSKMTRRMTSYFTSTSGKH